MLKKMRFGLDIETNGKDWDSELITVQLWNPDRGGCLFDCRFPQERKALIAVLEKTPNVEFVPFSALFDSYYILKDLGVSIFIAGDAFILALMAQKQNCSLDELSLEYLGRGKKGSLASVTDGQMSFDRDITPEMRNYAIEDARLAYELEEVMWKKYSDFGKVYQLERDLVPVLTKMRVNGLNVNKEVWREKVTELEGRYEELYHELATRAGRDFRSNSTKDVGEILFGTFGYTPVVFSPKTGVPSASEEALKHFDHDPWVQGLMELKHIKSVLSSGASYAPLLEHGKFHPEFRPLNFSGSSRIYTSNPALNQLPVELRYPIVPDEGYKFIYIDWVGAELIYMAHLAGETDIIKVYDSGGDVHRYVTSEITGTPQEEITDEKREISKVVTFSVIYGSMGGAPARALRLSFEEGRRYVDMFLSRFTNIRRYIEKQKDLTSQSGSVFTLYGRRRVLYKIHSKDKSVREEGERQSINSPVQNGVADLQKLALIKLDRGLPENCTLKFSVFDSFLIQVPEELDSPRRNKIGEALRSAFHFEFPDKKITFNMRFKAVSGKSFGLLQDKS